MSAKIKGDGKSTIFLLPVGNIEKAILDFLKSRLKEEFRCEVEIEQSWPLPQDAYNPERRQYLSSSILRSVRGRETLEKGDKVLAVCDVDLYVPQLNFVFGEAELGGHLAIISLTRLHQSFYGMPEKRELFLERTVKEAVHELGHTFGLSHCPDPKCVMHFSNSLLDTDRKEASFCDRCRKILQERKTLIKNK
ncbi:MAG: archaemetzincin family Zn-dependent metalloprotease [Candidatus Aminicenantales bacterium]